MTKNEDARALQKALNRAKLHTQSLICTVTDECETETGDRPEKTLTHLQNANKCLADAHVHLMLAEKTDGTVTTLGGGGGRG